MFDDARSTGSVVFLSNHVYESPRRAGFHWLADSFRDAGWTTTFVTTGLSQLSRGLGDRRIEAVDMATVGQIVKRGEKLFTLVELALYHPVDLRRSWLNRLVWPVFWLYGQRLGQRLRAVVSSADMVVFESSAALMYVEAVAKTNPRAKLVYRVSDDVRVIRFHPIVRAMEDRVVRCFDCISVPSEILHRRFAHLPQAFVHPHGLNKAAMDAAKGENPFPRDGKLHAVSIGSTLFDPDFLDVAAELRPDVTFHVVGAVETRYSRENIRQYGEVSFARAAAFTMHADLGLALYKRRIGAEYLAETSNKIGQYTYARLPIVAPAFIAEVPRPHVFVYDGSRASIAKAMDAALIYDRATINADVPSWDEIRNSIIVASNA